MEPLLEPRPSCETSLRDASIVGGVRTVFPVARRQIYRRTAFQNLQKSELLCPKGHNESSPSTDCHRRLVRQDRSLEAASRLTKDCRRGTPSRTKEASTATTFQPATNAGQPFRRGYCVRHQPRDRGTAGRCPCRHERNRRAEEITPDTTWIPAVRGRRGAAGQPPPAREVL